MLWTTTSPAAPQHYLINSTVTLLYIGHLNTSLYSPQHVTLFSSTRHFSLLYTSLYSPLHVTLFSSTRHFPYIYTSLYSPQHVILFTSTTVHIINFSS
ncbi:hypothetical protein Pmani_011021 [Petrolisthes manimaculis]|uniref:Uncharacterized protein n=1 Tax=Petrolisthes manimaculis TaxID=1843537 RepID=A0AAE1Q063_9EUCA|nr:hypothetical protein Pmani_011021 [Petrolisthes manimaculis]